MQPGTTLMAKVCVTVLAWAVLVQTTFAQTPTGEQPAVAAAKARGQLVVGVRYDFPPFGFVNEQKQVVGFDIDMARELAAALLGNREAIELKEVSGPNRIPFLVTNKVDVVAAALTMTPERAKTIAFSEPYYTGGYTIMVSKNNSDITSLKSLSGKRVAITRGATSDPIVSGVQPPPQQILKLEHISELYSVLESGRVDAVVQDTALLQPYVRRNPQYKLVGGLINEEPWAIGVRKGDTATLNFVNEQVKRMRESGKLDEWLAKWGLK